MALNSNIDGNNRKINYLRISITDRCNLRCLYCMPEEGIYFTPHGEVLTYEEILRLAALAAQLGIEKIRLTGGEPLVRKGVVEFIERLALVEGLKEITLTTNGVLLKDLAAHLKRAGVRRLNISMDTLKRERFNQITRRDYFDQVWAGIEEAERQGFRPIKLNVVAMRGINDDEILDFARLTLRKPYHVRFIEFMPVGEDSVWSSQRFIPTMEIFTRIQTLGAMTPVDSGRLAGPSQNFRLEGAVGQIGFIGAMSSHFCEKCNRMRLTAEGHLRGCLFSDHEIDIKTPLRAGRDDAFLRDLMAMAIHTKPRGLVLMDLERRKCVRKMSSIGG